MGTLSNVINGIILESVFSDHGNRSSVVRFRIHSYCVFRPGRDTTGLREGGASSWALSFMLHRFVARTKGTDCSNLDIRTSHSTDIAFLISISRCMGQAFVVATGTLSKFRAITSNCPFGGAVALVARRGQLASRTKPYIFLCKHLANGDYSLPPNTCRQLCDVWCGKKLFY